MSFKSYLAPEVIERASSPFNREIQVIRFLSESRLDMGGLTQSGAIISHIWKKALDRLLPPKFHPRKILLLGLGAGSSASLLGRRYPEAELIGIEIDPVVIGLGKKYFGLDRIKNLQIVNADALAYLKKLSPQTHLNLVLVDAYCGYQIPKSFENITFLKKLKRQTDFLFLNRLNWDEYEIATRLFIDALRPHFQLTFSRTTSNLVISLLEKD